MSNVLVIFQADTEATEQMALAVGVGAVEAEANIRLRRLAAPGAAEVAHKGYGKLKEPDLLWADTVVVGLESSRPKTEDLEDLFSLLNAVDPGKFKGKACVDLWPPRATTRPDRGADRCGILDYRTQASLCCPPLLCTS